MGYSIQKSALKRPLFSTGIGLASVSPITSAMNVSLGAIDGSLDSIPGAGVSWRMTDIAPQEAVGMGAATPIDCFARG